MSGGESKAPEKRYFLVKGSAAGIVDTRPEAEQQKQPKGHWRGLIEEGKDHGPGRSIFWTKKSQEVVLTQSALLECESDPEIVVVVIRELTAEQAEEHAQGVLAASAPVVDLGSLSVEALRAELARRQGKGDGQGQRPGR